jgi:hypothetical protein
MMLDRLPDRRASQSCLFIPFAQEQAVGNVHPKSFRPILAAQ